MSDDSQVLVFSRTLGYRHESIPTAVEALRGAAERSRVAFTFTEKTDVFTDEGLAQFKAIMFLSTTGEVLDTSGQAALQIWLDNGGALVSVHAGCACLFDNDSFVKQIGASFDHHPKLQETTFTRTDLDHPSTNMLPARWSFVEEVYFFRSDPRANGAQLVLSVDETSFDDEGSFEAKDKLGLTGRERNGSPHPVAWYQEKGAGVSPSGKAGRSFLTALGHTHEIWRDDLFIQHIMGGLQWALGSKDSLPSSS